MVCLAVDTIARGANLEKVSTRDLDGGDLGGGQPDQIGKDAPDDRGMADNKEVFLFSLELDEDRLEAD